MRYGKWIVIGPSSPGLGKPRVLCRCDCGVTRIVFENNLKRGLSTNCGCVRKEKIGRLNRSHMAGAARRIGNRAASVWLDMHKRCRDKTNPNYGGRGISVCLEWCGDFGFVRFFQDMGEPAPGTSLERIDNDGNYSRTNCRWAYPIEQQNNTRRNVHGWLDGKKMTAAQIGRELGIDRSTVARQIKKGMYGRT